MIKLRPPSGILPDFITTPEYNYSPVEYKPLVITKNTPISINEYSINSMVYESWNLPFCKASLQCLKCGKSWKDQRDMPAYQCPNCKNISHF